MSVTNIADLRNSFKSLSSDPVLLMCPPDFYELREPNPVSGAANDFEVRGYKEYQKDPKSFLREAAKQWNSLKQAFVDLGIEICEITPSKKCPDLVFTADPTVSIVKNGSGGNGTRFGNAITLLSRFSNEERQTEVEINAAFFEQNLPDRAMVVSHYRIEGSGDNVYDVYRDVFWSGYSQKPGRENAAAGRSDLRAHEALSAATGVEVISLPVQRPFFHIDTALAPLSKGHVVFYEGGILPKAVETFQTKAFAEFGLPTKDYLIPVSKEDAEKLACNLVCLDNVIVMPKCSEGLQERIRKAGYEVITRDVSCFIASGGAVHCLTNNVNQRRAIGGLVNSLSHQRKLALTP